MRKEKGRVELCEPQRNKEVYRDVERNDLRWH